MDSYAYGSGYKTANVTKQRNYKTANVENSEITKQRKIIYFFYIRKSTIKFFKKCSKF